MEKYSLYPEQPKKTDKVKEAYRKSYTQGKENTPGLYKKLVNDYNEGEALLTLGPNYLVFLTSFLIVNVISFVIIGKLAGQERFRPFYIISIVIVCYLDVVWLATALINPGIAPNATSSEGDHCDKCLTEGREIMRCEGRVHCNDCLVCIDQQVMHFKLVGACIGKNNFVTFKLLLLGLFMWTLSVIMIIPQTLHMV